MHKAFNDVNTAKSLAEAAKTAADQQRANAVAETQIALSSQLLAQANEIFTDRPALLPSALCSDSTPCAATPRSRPTACCAAHKLCCAPLRTPITHTANIRAIVYSPDGTLLASASDDRTARVSDARTCAQRFLVQHPQAVESLAFSPDSTLLATASADGTTRLWNAHTDAPRTAPLPLKFKPVSSPSAFIPPDASSPPAQTAPSASGTCATPPHRSSKLPSTRAPPQAVYDLAAGTPSQQAPSPIPVPPSAPTVRTSAQSPEAPSPSSTGRPQNRTASGRARPPRSNSMASAPPLAPRRNTSPPPAMTAPRASGGCPATRIKAGAARDSASWPSQ